MSHETAAGGLSARPAAATARPAGRTSDIGDQAYRAAFVLLVCDDNGVTRVLLSRERRGSETRLGVLGGKREAADGGFPTHTASREAWEETGQRLSEATRRRLRDGELIGRTWHGQSKAHVLVHRIVEAADFDLDSRFPAGGVPPRPGSKTVQLGVAWVPLASVLDAAWRRAHMHTHASVLAAAALPFLRDTSFHPFSTTSSSSPSRVAPRVIQRPPPHISSGECRVPPG